MSPVYWSELVQPMHSWEAFVTQEVMRHQARLTSEPEAPPRAMKNENTLDASDPASARAMNHGVVWD